jgi:hypothetical protein
MQVFYMMNNRNKKENDKLLMVTISVDIARQSWQTAWQHCSKGSGDALAVFIGCR